MVVWKQQQREALAFHRNFASEVLEAAAIEKIAMRRVGAYDFDSLSMAEIHLLEPLCRARTLPASTWRMSAERAASITALHVKC